MTINELPARGRCRTCGRFRRRGLWNYILHDGECPEREIIVFSIDPKKCKLIKRKHLKNQ